MSSIFKNIIKPFFGHRLGRFYPIKAIFNFSLWLFRKLNITAQVDGQKISLGSKVGLELFVHVIQRPFEIEAFKQQILREGRVVLDLGANIGYYTLIAAELAGKDGKVFAFEPDSTNFAMLERNIKLNGYKNIIPVQKAVSNKTGKSKLYLCKDDFSCHSICRSQDDWQAIEIETVRLDDYFRNYQDKIDFIKMDIEGAEGWAFEGMTSILKKNKNLRILTEFNPFLLKKSGIEPQEYLGSLIKHNFKLHYINEKEKKIGPITVDELINKCPVGEYVNLLCLRGNNI